MEKHEMQLIDGVWHCDICGRKMRLSPGKLDIIEPGNRWARHFGGGLIRSVCVQPAEFDADLWGSVFDADGEA